MQGKFSRFIPVAAAFIAAASIAPCAAENIPMDPAWAAGIRTIALVGPVEPKHYTAISTNTRGGFLLTQAVLGIDGALLGTAIFQPSGERALRNALEDQNLKLSIATQGAVKAALEVKGISVALQITEHKQTRGLMRSYYMVRTSADAILDIAYHSPVYIDLKDGRVAPGVIAEIRILTGKTHKTIFEQSYLYQDPKPEGFGSEDYAWIPVDEKYVFPSFEAAAEKPELAGEGILAAAPKVARIVVDVLKR